MVRCKCFLYAALSNHRFIAVLRSEFISYCYCFIEAYSCIYKYMIFNGPIFTSCSPDQLSLHMHFLDGPVAPIGSVARVVANLCYILICVITCITSSEVGWKILYIHVPMYRTLTLSWIDIICLMNMDHQTAQRCLQIRACDPAGHLWHCYFDTPSWLHDRLPG